MSLIKPKTKFELELFINIKCISKCLLTELHLLLKGIVKIFLFISPKLVGVNNCINRFHIEVKLL